MPRTSIHNLGLVALTVCATCAPAFNANAHYPAVLQSFVDTIIHIDSLWFADSAYVCVAVRDRENDDDFRDPDGEVLDHIESGRATLVPFSTCGNLPLGARSGDLVVRLHDSRVCSLGASRAAAPQSRSHFLCLSWIRLGPDCSRYIGRYRLTRNDSHWVNDSTKVVCLWD